MAAPAADEPSGRGVRGGATLDVAWATSGTAKGDADAFEALYRAWFERVYAMSRAATGRDEAFCLDVTQEVMLRAASSIPVLRAESELSAWLGRVAIRTAIDMLRRESRRARREKAAAGAERVNVESGAEAGERAEWLTRELERLPLADYGLVIQRLVVGRTLREAGMAVGVSEGAAHGRVRRLVQRLRDLAREVWL